MVVFLAAQAKNSVDDVDVIGRGGRGCRSETTKSASQNAGVSNMSAKRGLSVVSAKSASGTFAQMLARIHGMDGGGKKNGEKDEMPLPQPVPTYLRCWKRFGKGKP